MNTFTTNWTKEELKVYALLFCAKADFVATNEEVDFIKSKTSAGVYDNINTEFEGDNDYQSIEKIQNTIKRLGYTCDENQELIEEIKTLFLADGKYDTLERNLLIGMKRIMEKKEE